MGSARSRRSSCGSRPLRDFASRCVSTFRTQRMAKIRRATRAGGTSLAAALTQFGIAGVIAALLLGVVAVEVLRRTGTRDATNDAKRVTGIVGTGIVEPRVTD